LKSGRSCRACGRSHHDVMNVSPVGRRYVSRMLKKSFFSPARPLRAGCAFSHAAPCGTALLSILQGCSPLVPDVQATEVLLYQNGFSQSLRLPGPSVPAGPWPACYSSAT
jgi:hypothetical protein